MSEMLFWIIFIPGILALLALDLLVFQRKSHVVSVREALIWSAFWIGLALLFNLGVYFWRGPEAALAYLTGYLIEKSLSVDNLFVFLVLFSFFNVADKLQHRVLFWGILGAMVMRAIFIFAGIALITRLHWIIYVFGVFLIYTGVKLALSKGKKVEPEHNPVLRLIRRFFPVTETYHGGKFITRENGRLMLTPLFVVLVAIESTDVVFAVDSIPAIMSITLDPIIVYSSNIFAILGLRALFFALAGVMRMFRYLNYGLSIVLIFTGVKMLLADYAHIPTWIALGVVLLVLTVSIVMSIIWHEQDEDEDEAEADSPQAD